MPPSGSLSAPSAPAGQQRPGLTIPDVSVLGPPAQGPELVVLDGAGASRVPLGRRPIVIGRDPGCDLVVASRFVSGRHMRVEPDAEAGGFRVVDSGSTNGVLRAGRRLAPGAATALADGDALRIGDPTTGSFVTILFRDPRAPRAPGGAIVRRYPLGGRAVVTIGRAGADIPLDNPAVSRRHAVVEASGGGHAIRDLGATNGTFVDGERVGRAALRRGAVVRDRALPAGVRRPEPVAVRRARRDPDRRAAALAGRARRAPHPARRRRSPSRRASSWRWWGAAAPASRR